jgi:hypothetical protein
MSKKFRYIDLFAAQNALHEERPVLPSRACHTTFFYNVSSYNVLHAPHHSSRRVVSRNNITTVITTHDDEDHQFAVNSVRPLTEDDLRALENPEPPHLAEFLLTALAFSRRAEHAIGDLNEQYAREYREFGAKRAGLRYWAKALQSLAPLLVRAVGKALKWGAVIDMVRRHL